MKNDTNMKNDEYWMKHAIQLAKIAESKGEVPIGAILVLEGEIIGEGYNQPITMHDPTAHAEMMALRDGAKNLQNYRLINSVLYVTKEPCLMCLGAMVHGRISRLVYGASDPKFHILNNENNEDNKDNNDNEDNIDNKRSFHHNNHQFLVTGGVLQKECAHLLLNFFKSRR